MNLKYKYVLAVISTVFMLCPSTYAWDGVATGAIRGFEITQGGNFAFRVILDSAGEMCGPGSVAGWAFINEADSNYKVYVANFMMARTLSKPVTIYMSRVSGTILPNRAHELLGSVTCKCFRSGNRLIQLVG